MGFLRSQDTTAFVELALAAHCRVSAAGVSDAPTDRTDRRRLNPHNDLSPARMPAAMKRLFIDSGVASSRPRVDGKVLRFCQVGRLFPFRLNRAKAILAGGTCFPAVLDAPAGHSSVGCQGGEISEFDALVVVPVHVDGRRWMT
jgi:hypothetical protein